MLIFRVSKVGPGADYAQFYHYALIPAIDIQHGMADVVSLTIIVFYCFDCSYAYGQGRREVIGVRGKTV